MRGVDVLFTDAAGDSGSAHVGGDLLLVNFDVRLSEVDSLDDSNLQSRYATPNRYTFRLLSTCAEPHFVNSVARFIVLTREVECG